jgi:hypothetical protein
LQRGCTLPNSRFSLSTLHPISADYTGKCTVGTARAIDLDFGPFVPDCRTSPDPGACRVVCPKLTGRPSLAQELIENAYGTPGDLRGLWPINLLMAD